VRLPAFLFAFRCGFLLFALRLRLRNRPARGFLLLALLLWSPTGAPAPTGALRPTGTLTFGRTFSVRSLLALWSLATFRTGSITRPLTIGTLPILRTLSAFRTGSVTRPLAIGSLPILRSLSAFRTGSVTRPLAIGSLRSRATFGVAPRATWSLLIRRLRAFTVLLRRRLPL
jgi:hypothetical protein